MLNISLRTVASSLAALGLIASAASAQQASTPKKGGTAVVAVGADATMINASMTTGNTEVAVGCMVYEGLTVFNAKTDLPEPALAESWTISPDGKTYTFKLRKTNWHDGKPFTSEDVRYTYMEVISKLSPTFSAQAGKILQAIETPDEHTAVFKLSEPYGPLLRVLSCPYTGAVMPAHIFKGSDPLKNPANQKPIGTGAFKFQEWTRGEKIVFVRNDQYWNQPRPYLDSVVYRIMPSSAARVQALFAGEVDYIQFVYFPPSDRKAVSENPKTKLEVAAYPPNTLHGFFNLQRKPFDDVRVRNALLVATDRKYILDNAFFGSGRQASAPWATQIEWARNPDVDYDKSHLFNPEKAGQMLEEAGYKADANRVRFKVTINYDSSSAERGQIALMLQAWWKRAGVEVTPQPLETAVLVPRMHTEHNFDFYIASYQTYGDPAVGVARSYITSTINNPFGNAAGYSNPEVDALFDKATKLTSVEERGAVYRQIQTILMKGLPAISLHENKAADAASKKLMDAWTYAGAGFWQTAWLASQQSATVATAAPAPDAKSARSKADWDACAGNDPNRGIVGCTAVLQDNAESAYKRAIAYYNRALAYYNRGFSHGPKSDFGQAIYDYTEAIRLNPKNAVAYSNRGLAYWYRDDYDRAIADYTEAIRLDPKHAIAYDNRGIAYWTDRTKDGYDRAIADPGQVLRLDNAAFQSALAERRKQQSGTIAAAPTLSMIDSVFGKSATVAAAPPAPVAASAASKANWDACTGKDPDRSIDGCTAILHDNAETAQNRALAYFNRGVSYWAKGNLSDIDDFTEAIRLDPKNASAYNSRGVAYQTRGDNDRAINDFTVAIQLDPKYASAYSNRGLAYQAKGDNDIAIVNFTDAIQLDPKYASAYNGRGVGYQAKGENYRAILNFADAIRLDPTDASAYYGRGVVYHGMGDYDRAVADLNEAVRLSPKDPSSTSTVIRSRYRSALGLAYFGRGQNRAKAKGDYDGAIADLKEAVRISRVYESALENIRSQRPPAGTVSSDRRVALVIGNGAYRAVPVLANPNGDAELVAAALRRAGMDVTVVQNVDRADLVSALREFGQEADNADWALIYYAGHGIEIGGTNYIIPVDARLATDRDITDEAVSLDRLLSSVEGARKLRVVVLDACRDNPFTVQMRVTSAQRSAGRGLARVDPPKATLVAYSAKAGSTAADGDGTNSPFAVAFARRIVEPGVEINKVFRFIGDDVQRATGQKQEPFTYGALPPEDFFFIAVR